MTASSIFTYLKFATLQMDRDKTKKRMKEEAATLGQWKGFTKSVIHNNRKVNIALPLFLEENDSPLIPCDHCPKKFKNTQGHSVHLKCAHPEMLCEQSVSVKDNFVFPKWKMLSSLLYVTFQHHLIHPCQAGANDFHFTYQFGR